MILGLLNERATETVVDPHWCSHGFKLIFMAEVESWVSYTVGVGGLGK